MKTRSLVFGALGALFVLGAVTPAFADRDDWRRREWREHEHREHEWREHEWREHHRPWNYGYYAPPAYYGGSRW